MKAMVEFPNGALLLAKSSDKITIIIAVLIYVIAFVECF